MIQKALNEMDKVIVMVYEDKCINIPVKQRTGWIKDIFSKYYIEIIECYNGPQEKGYTDEIIKKHDNYILDKVGNMGVTHFYSSEKYGEHVSKALNAIDRRIDMKRNIVPISASKIRKDTYKYKNFIPPEVLSDLIYKIAFLGAESTGKTTMTKVCAEHFNTNWVYEYGDQYWHENNRGGILSKSELCHIAEEQCKLEDKYILEANKYLFCDTTPLTTYMFSKSYHNHVPLSLRELISKRQYDITFVCANDFPFDCSNGRRNEEVAIKEQINLLKELNVRKIKYFTLLGTVGERLEQVSNVLKSLPKHFEY